MARFLSLLPLAGGNVSPTLGILRELLTRGHSVRILGHPTVGPELERAGLGDVRLDPVHHARPWNPRASDPGIRDMLAWLALASDRGIGRDLENAVASDRPDALLVDCMLPGALGAVRSCGIPAAILFHTLLPYWDVQWSARSPMGLWLRATGTLPMRRGRLPEVLILATDPDFDPVGAGPIPRGRIVQAGAIVPDPTPARPRAAGTRVLVSLSTIGYPGQLDTLRRIVNAIGDVGTPAVVTTGPAIDPAALPVVSGVEVLAFGDHTELLRSARLLIGHGGHGTTMRALAAGVPVLVVPMSRHADHVLVGAAVERMGVGAWLAKDASPDAFRAAIAGALLDDGMTRRAMHFSAQLRTRSGGAANAADALEDLASDRRDHTGR